MTFDCVIICVPAEHNVVIELIITLVITPHINIVLNFSFYYVILIIIILI